MVVYNIAISFKILQQTHTDGIYIYLNIIIYIIYINYIYITVLIIFIHHSAFKVEMDILNKQEQILSTFELI